MATPSIDLTSAFRRVLEDVDLSSLEQRYLPPKYWSQTPMPTSNSMSNWDPEFAFQFGLAQTGNTDAQAPSDLSRWEPEFAYQYALSLGKSVASASNAANDATWQQPAILAAAGVLLLMIVIGATNR